MQSAWQHSRAVSLATFSCGQPGNILARLAWQRPRAASLATLPPEQHRSSGRGACAMYTTRRNRYATADTHTTSTNGDP
eukprot:15436360-Alexandrium_andersonii.AAC.1